MSSREFRRACKKPKEKTRSKEPMPTDELKSPGKNRMHTSTIQPGIFAAGTDPQLSEEIQNRIGDQLRLLYDHIVDEEIPQSLLKLLKRLESRQ